MTTHSNSDPVESLLVSFEVTKDGANVYVKRSSGLRPISRETSERPIDVTFPKGLHRHGKRLNGDLLRIEPKVGCFKSLGNGQAQCAAHGCLHLEQVTRPPVAKNCADG